MPQFVSAPVETAQTPFELHTLLTIVEDLDPDKILEIGTWYGGTLWHWLQIADTVVAVDDRMVNIEAWKDWARDAGTDLHLLQGMSYHDDLLEQARELGPYQFLLIDAEHTYEAVKTDWDLYRPMVEDGGVICFHDFQARSGPYGVNILWNDIKSVPGTRTIEIVETSDPPGFQGIAAVWV